MKPCSTCAGTLQWPLGRVRGDQDWPCEKCLSFPANDALRAFAKEWLGFSPWNDTHGAIGAPWWHKYKAGAPAYLPAGMDLLARWLWPEASRDQCTIAPSWSQAIGGGSPYWILGDGDHTFGAVQDGWIDVVVPELASIPAGAPEHLQNARAMVLCAHANEVSR